MGNFTGCGDSTFVSSIATMSRHVSLLARSFMLHANVMNAMTNTMEIKIKVNMVIRFVPFFQQNGLHRTINLSGGKATSIYLPRTLTTGVPHCSLYHL